MNSPPDLRSDKLSDEAKDLISRMLQKKVKERITPSQIQSHKFFANIDFDRIYKKQISPPFVPNLVLMIINFKSGPDDESLVYFDDDFTSQDPSKESVPFSYKFSTSRQSINL